MKKKNFTFWLLVWGLGIAGQICWNMENQWFATFVYAKIAYRVSIVNWMTAISAAATCLSTFIFGCLSDRKGNRRLICGIGYIIWGIFTIVYGLTEFIPKGNGANAGTMLAVAGVAVVGADAIMSFFGSMGNDIGLNAWINDHMNDKNRGQLGAAIATQPVIGTILGTVVGGILVGSDDNYMRLFVVMGLFVICFGVLSLFFMKDSEELMPNEKGSFSKQFFSIFNFKNYMKNRELVWVNLSICVFFIAFNMYFVHLGNYMIYYLGFLPDMMGPVEGVGLVIGMLCSIPMIKLLNGKKEPFVCILAVILNCIGNAILGLFVRPDNIDTATIMNPILLLGVIFIGAGYVTFLQATTAWGKRLYPEDARGQFEGIRILFFVLIPMVVAPLIAGPIVKGSGTFVDEYGEIRELPTHTMFIAGAILVLLTFVPLYYAKKWHGKRTGGTGRIAESTVI